MYLTRKTEVIKLCKSAVKPPQQILKILHYNILYGILQTRETRANCLHHEYLNSSMFPDGCVDQAVNQCSVHPTGLQEPSHCKFISIIVSLLF